MRRLRSPLIVLALLLMAVPSAASAREMEVAMQDDLTILNTEHDRDLALIQFSGMGGTHVRMTIEHSRERKARRDTRFADGSSRLPVRFYDEAVDRVLEFGLVPEITLFWRNEANPKRLSAWMGNVARHFGGRVNRYSIHNEPDLYLPEPRCNAARQQALASAFPGRMTREAGELVAKVKTRPGFVSLKRACQRYQRGRQYKRLFGPSARAVRKANRGVEILAGETSPVRGVDWFFIGAQARKLNADGWAHHPFQFQNLNPSKPTESWGIGNLRLLKRTVRMPVYLTEFGYPRPNSSMDRREYGRRLSEDEVARAYVKAWQVARRAGARQMLHFQWFVKRKPIRGEFWDTALNGKDDGTYTPMYRALRRLILSWR